MLQLANSKILPIKFAIDCTMCYNIQLMGSGFEESCGRCAPYSRARLNPLTHGFTIEAAYSRAQVNQRCEVHVTEEIRYALF